MDAALVGVVGSIVGTVIGVELKSCLQRHVFAMSIDRCLQQQLQFRERRPSGVSPKPPSPRARSGEDGQATLCREVKSTRSIL